MNHSFVFQARRDYRDVALEIAGFIKLRKRKKKKEERREGQAGELKKKEKALVLFAENMLAV